MGDHALRNHSTLSPSNAYQWMECTPSVILGLQFPDPSSSAAEEGTLAHELAELKVRNYFFTTDFGKRKLNAEIKKLKTKEIWDDEMMGYTDDYLDYIKSVALKFQASPHVDIERREAWMHISPICQMRIRLPEALTVFCWGMASFM